MFKYNNKNPQFTPCFGVSFVNSGVKYVQSSRVSVVNSEHVIAGWVNCYPIVKFEYFTKEVCKV